MVAASVNLGWLSPERAQTVHGVALRLAANGFEYTLGGGETERRRGQAAVLAEQVAVALVPA